MLHAQYYHQSLNTKIKWLKHRKIPFKTKINQKIPNKIQREKLKVSNHLQYIVMLDSQVSVLKFPISKHLNSNKFIKRFIEMNKNIVKK